MRRRVRSAAGHSHGNTVAFSVARVAVGDGAVAAWIAAVHPRWVAVRPPCEQHVVQRQQEQYEVQYN